MLETIIISVVIILVGMAAHFLYDLTNHNKIVGLFAAVNESTWEHIKIALTPILFCGLYDGFVYGENPNYFLAKLVSIVTPIVVIPCVFYSYKAIVKKPVLFVDILTFCAAIFLSQFLFRLIIDMPAIPYVCEYLATVGVFAIFAAYTTLTLMPLKLGLFKDPISKKYGIKAHTEEFNIFKKRGK